MSAFAVSIILLRLVLPWAVRRSSEAQLLTYAMFVACGAFCAVSLFQEPWALAAVSFLLGMGCGCGQPLSMTLVYNASPKGRAGEATGMRITVNQITHIAIPLMFGAVGTAVGLSAVFFANAGFLVAGGYHELAQPRAPAAAMKRMRLLALALALACAPLASADDFGACVSRLRREAVGKGIAPQMFDSALSRRRARPERARRDGRTARVRRRRSGITSPGWSTSSASPTAARCSRNGAACLPRRSSASASTAT